MCGRFVSPSERDIEREFQLRGRDVDLFDRRYNVAPTVPVPIIRAGDAGAELVMARWGLLPRNSPEPKTHLSTHNARLETIATKWTWRWPLQNRRCIVPVAGWYEWEEIQVPGAKKPVKQPWYLHAGDDHTLGFAGLWDRWTHKETGETVDSCTVVVTESVDAMGRVHDRMPVILPAAEHAAWMDPQPISPEAAVAMLGRFKVAGLVMYPVSTAVNSSRSQGAQLIEPISDEVVSLG
jgi:putative SOS response-associated peptidase YedK